MEQSVLEALLWGLSNPDGFAAWYSAYRTHMESMIPTMHGAGLDVEELPPLPEYLANSEQIVRDYERDIGPLASIPPRLVDEATALGWKILE